MGNEEFDGDVEAMKMASQILARKDLTPELRKIVVEIRESLAIGDEDFHDFIRQSDNFMQSCPIRQQVNYARAAKLAWTEMDSDTVLEIRRDFDRLIKPLKSDDEIEASVLEFPNPIHGPFVSSSEGHRVYFSSHGAPEDFTSCRKILASLTNALRLSRSIVTTPNQMEVTRRVWDHMALPQLPGGIDMFISEMAPPAREWRILWIEYHAGYGMCLVLNQTPGQQFDQLRSMLMVSGSRYVWLE